MLMESVCLERDIQTYWEMNVINMKTIIKFMIIYLTKMKFVPFN